MKQNPFKKNLIDFMYSVINFKQHQVIIQKTSLKL